MDMNIELIDALVLGVDVFKRLEEKNIFNKVKEAKFHGQDIRPIVESTEPLVFETIDNVTKPDDELNAEEREIKARITVALLNHNYEFFELGQMYDEHAPIDEIQSTVEKVKLKHLVDVKKSTDEQEEIFIYDSLDNQ